MKKLSDLIDKKQSVKEAITDRITSTVTIPDPR